MQKPKARWPKSQPARSAPQAAREKKTSKTQQTGGTVRQAKVERAKKLVQDPNYPSKRVLGSVAKLLAKNWERVPPQP